MNTNDPLQEYVPELDPVIALTDAAWAKTVKGTWSKSDKRIFAMGFREGWLERGRQIKKAMETDLEERRLIQSGMDGRGGFLVMDKADRTRLKQLANDAIIDLFGREGREVKLAVALETCLDWIEDIADQCEHCRNCEYHGDHADKPTIFTSI